LVLGIITALSFSVSATITARRCLTKLRKLLIQERAVYPTFPLTQEHIPHRNLDPAAGG
jgi:hypothetical protein